MNIKTAGENSADGKPRFNRREKNKIPIDLNCRHIVADCLKTGGRGKIDLLAMTVTRLMSITVHCQQLRQQ